MNGWVITSNSPFQGSYLYLGWNNLGSQQESESINTAKNKPYFYFSVLISLKH